MNSVERIRRTFKELEHTVSSFGMNIPGYELYKGASPLESSSSIPIEVVELVNSSFTSYNDILNETPAPLEKTPETTIDLHKSHLRSFLKNSICE